MILDIGNTSFKDIFKRTELELPILWDGKDFKNTVEALLKNYLGQSQGGGYVKRPLVGAFSACPINTYKTIMQICKDIVLSIEHYLNGFPAKAFYTFSKVMEKAMLHPVRTYLKTGDYVPEDLYNDFLRLYRIRQVNENKIFRRGDIFHTPYGLRSKVKTCRYSIAGYPSLYLSTDLELCSQEMKNSDSRYKIASRFRLIRDSLQHSINIKVIELALKPQDFFPNNDFPTNRKFHELNINDSDAQSNYFMWYPIIAVCSFIRTNKDDAFAPEYIIPQLLMQWLRDYNSKQEFRIFKKMCDEHGIRCNKCGDKCQWNKDRELYGVRYFSCASNRASDMGFNYVFPVSGVESPHNKNYCDILTKVFKLTKPVYLHEFESLRKCADKLNTSDFDYIETT